MLVGNYRWDMSPTITKWAPSNTHLERQDIKTGRVLVLHLASGIVWVIYSNMLFYVHMRNGGGNAHLNLEV